MYIYCDISSAELWPVLLLCVVKKCWYHLPEDGKTMLPKHAGGVWKIEHTNYRTVLLLVLHSYLLHHSALNKQYKIIWYSCMYLVWIILTSNNVLKESKDSQTVHTNTVFCHHCVCVLWTLLSQDPRSLCRDYGVCFLCGWNSIFGKSKVHPIQPWRA
jgi:hypothetical protein